jgi:asparagine synthetase B (glutamine-hydrolysing)
MPVLAGWLTGEQVPPETIEQAILAMGEVLKRHGGQPAQLTESGAGLITFTDPTHAMQQNDEPPVLDWVPERRTLVYRRPLAGGHPLYYIENWPAQGNLLFASEMKALFAVGVPRKLHSAALQALAHYGFIPAPWTIFQDIFVVPSGSILRWQRAKTVLNHAVDYHFDHDEKLSSSDALEQLYQHLQKASAGLLPPHEQVVALTNGGGNSALATLLAAQHTSTPFTVSAIDYTKSESEEAWHGVEEVAQACKSPLLTIQGVDQPEFWVATVTGIEAPCITTRPLTLHQLLHTTAVETGAHVAVTGLGANALFEHTPAIDHTGTTASTIALDTYRQRTKPLSEELVASLWSPDFTRTLQTANRWEETLHARKLARRAEQFTDPRLAQYYLDLHLRLPDQLVTPLQQLAIQEGMAMRSPYLHPHSIELLTQLPPILEDGLQKNALAEHFLRHSLRYQSPLTSSPTQTAPTASLRERDTSDLLHTLLSPEALKDRGIFEPQAVEMLLQQPDNGEANSALVFVFTTQLLCQLFHISIPNRF